MMADSSDSMDLNLILRVQRARMMHDAEAQPSQVPGVYWIEAKNPRPDAAQPTARSGEWRIPTSADAVDELWARIKAATEAGVLGYKSKVSTSPARGQAGGEERMICVRSYDADDRADVERIAAELRRMGIQQMSYTRDH